MKNVKQKTLVDCSFREVLRFLVFMFVLSAMGSGISDSAVLDGRNIDSTDGNIGSIKAYKQAKNIGTIEALIIYLQKFPKDPYADKALNDLNLTEEKFYLFAVFEDSVIVYQYFLDHYGGSSFHSEIADRLKSLRAAQDALTQNTEKSFRKYLTDFPEGYHADLLRKKMVTDELFHYEYAVKEDTAYAYHSYLIEFANGDHKDEIERRYVSLSFFQLAEKENRVEPLLKYLDEFPAGFHAEKVKNRLEELRFDFFCKVDTIWGYDFFLKQYPDSRFKTDVDTLREKTFLHSALLRNDRPNNNGKSAVQEVMEKESVGSSTENTENSLQSKRRTQLLENVVEQELAGGFTPLMEPFGKSTCRICPSAVFFLKNPLNRPVTLILKGPESLTMNFQPGEGGRIKRGSGRYQVTLIAGSTPEMKWSGEFDFSGEYLLILNENGNALRLIAIKELTLLDTSSMVAWAGKLYEEYRTSQEASRSETLEALFPIRDVPVAQEEDSSILATKQNKRNLLQQVSQSEQEWLAMELGEILNKPEKLHDDLRNILQTPPDHLWPLLGLLIITNEQIAAIKAAGQVYKRLSANKKVIINNILQGGQGVAEVTRQAMVYGDKQTRSDLLQILEKSGGVDYEDLFLATLEEPNLFNRRTSALWCEKHPTQKAFLPLIDLIYGSHEPTTRNAALTALDGISFSDSNRSLLNEEYFRKILAAYNGWMRNKYRKYSHTELPLFVRNIPRGKVEESLFAMIQSEDPIARRFLCEILMGDVEQEDLPLLKSCMQVSNPRILCGLVDSFAGLTVEGKDQYFQALFMRGKELGAGKLQDKAIQGLVDMKTHEAVGVLINMLSSDINPRYFSVIARELGGIGSPEAQQALFTWLRTEDVKDGVTEGLAREGSEESLAALVQCAFVLRNKWRYSCSAALKEADQGEVLKALSKNLSGYPGGVRADVLSFIAGLEVEGAIEILVQALSDDDSNIRINMARKIYEHEVEIMKSEQPYRLIESLMDNTIPEDALERVIAFLGEKKVLQSSEAVKRVFSADLGKGKINYKAMRTLQALGEVEILRQASAPVMAQLEAWKGNSFPGRLLDALVLTNDERGAQFLIDWSNSHEEKSVIVSKYLGRTGNRIAVHHMSALLDNLLTDTKQYDGPSSVYKQIQIVIEALGEIEDVSSFRLLEKLLENKTIKQRENLYQTTFSAISKFELPERDQIVVQKFDSLKESYTERGNSALSRELDTVNSADVIEDLLRIIHNGNSSASLKAFKIITKIVKESGGEIDLVELSEKIGDIQFTFHPAITVDWLTEVGKKSLDDLYELSGRYMTSSKHVSYFIRAYGGSGMFEALNLIIQAHDIGLDFCLKEERSSTCVDLFAKDTEKAIGNVLILKYPGLYALDISVDELRTKMLRGK